MAITQTISTIPDAGHRGIDTRNDFVTKQEAFQDALTATTVTQLNTFASQANTLATEVNALKSDTQSIKDDAVSETTAIKDLAVDAKDDAVLAQVAAETARDEAVGAAATLPDGIINDATISTTDTWSSDKISKQTMVSKPTITSPTNGAIDFIGAVTATYATSTTYTGAQNYVRWECSTSQLFGTLVDSYEGASNLLSWTPSIGMALTTVYVRVKQGSDNHISTWSDTVSFTTPNVYVQTPTMTVTGTPSDVTATPTLTTSAFSVYNGTDTHASTDWIVTKVSDGTTVWASMGNTTNKTSITMPSGVLMVSTAYVFSARHNGATYGGSAFAQVSGTTKSAFTVSGNEIAKITASDKAAGDYFGYSVSLSSDGTTLAVGARAASPSGIANAGACYVYKYNGSSWVETKITASDKAANDYFGQSVSLSSDGTTLAVSAYAASPSGIANAGACYVYKYNGSSWVETKITASDKAAGDYFGYSVSLSSDGTTLAVGAYAADPSGVSGAGACYIYKYNGTSWVETKITASDKAANDYFGYSVSLSSDGTTLAVGAYAASPSGIANAGACYVYKYNGSSWVETKITASDKAASDYFGYSVSLSSDGTTLAVGAYAADPSGVSGAGACYIYKYNGTSWVETKITASDKAANDYFGQSVSLSSDGTTLAVGAYAADPSGVSGAGACYIYKYNGTSWVETKITASDKAAGDYFGYSVSLSSDGTTLAVGARAASPSGIANAGACYVYK